MSIVIFQSRALFFNFGKVDVQPENGCECRQAESRAAETPESVPECVPIFLSFSLDS
jgi:hypothetical protein